MPRPANQRRRLDNDPLHGAPLQPPAIPDGDPNNQPAQEEVNTPWFDQMNHNELGFGFPGNKKFDYVHVIISKTKRL